VCEPTLLVIAATATAAAGTAYGGYTALQESKYTNAVAQNNAKLERDAAYDSEVRGQRSEMQKWREIAATRSAQIAAFAANGFDTSFGSAADVTGDTLALGFEDTNTIRENASREARGHIISAQNYREQGAAALRSGKQAAIKAGFQTVGTILGGAGQLQSMKPATAQASTVSGWFGAAPPKMFGATGGFG